MTSGSQVRHSARAILSLCFGNSCLFFYVVSMGTAPSTSPCPKFWLALACNAHTMQPRTRVRPVSLWLVHTQHGMSVSPVVLAASVHCLGLLRTCLSLCPCWVPPALRSTLGARAGEIAKAGGRSKWCLRQAAHRQPHTRKAVRLIYSCFSRLMEKKYFIKP